MKPAIVGTMGILIVPVLLAACTGTGGHQMVDVRPIGEGLNFLGLAGVLAALIFVFGRFTGDSMLPTLTSYLFTGLFILLALVVAVTAIPQLILPITVIVTVLVVLAVFGNRWG